MVSNGNGFNVGSHIEYLELANLSPEARASIWELLNLHHPHIASSLDDLKADKHYRELFVHFGACVLLKRADTHPDIINLIQQYEALRDHRDTTLS